jgi:hypothetical protein
MMESMTIWLGALITLCVFSYAVKDNAAYRLVQNATLGTYMGMFIIIMWDQILYPRWWQPMIHGFRAMAAPGGYWADVHWTAAFWLLALIPGSLWYFQMSRRWFWLSTIISGFFVGVAAGLAFKTQILLIMPQISATIAPINPFAGEHAVTLSALWQGDGEAWATVGMCLNNLILVVLLLAALFYFFFSVRTEHRVLAGSVRFGRVAIMVCLGALFGNTVMTRVAFLIERLLFLYRTWGVEQVGRLFSG